MDDPKDPRKELSQKLAELLEDPKALHALRLAELLGVFRTAGEGANQEEEIAGGREEASGQQEDPRPIRIWKPRFEDGKLLFERPRPGPFGDHYASRAKVWAEKPSAVRRICFFGESAAAGYLYAPHLTPAQALEQQLNQAGGADSFEVVDLARSNETLGPMLAAVRDSLQLNPDILVIFSGNNWHLLETPELSPAAPSLRSRQHCALALRSAGLEGLAHLARSRLERSASQALNRLAQLADKAGIPVILVLPEVNLADWENRQPVPWLPGDATSRWYKLREEAEAQLKSEQWEAALRTAGQMQRLDRGLCPTSHRLLARAWIGLGKLDEARKACEDEVEAAADYPLLCFLGAPQSTRQVGRILKRSGRRHSFYCVDLPGIFAEWTSSPLPDRRLFLDYCHLSKEGIRVAMSAVASQVLQLESEKAPTWHELLRQSAPPEIAPQTEAAASLGAALHSAHRLACPDGQLLEHWLRQALKASPQAAQVMLDLVSARCSPCPAVLTAAQQRLADSPIPLSLQHGWQYDFLDAELLEALLKVLEDEHPELARQATEMLLRHLSVGPEPIELSRPPYLWNPLERFFSEVMPSQDLAGRAFYRSPWPVSRFCLLTDGQSGIRLEATLRLPAIEGLAEPRCGQVRLQVNGIHFASFAASPDWKCHSAEVKPEQLRKGLNKLTLHWPPLPAAGDLALQSAIARLEQGIEADLHPVFGEVFSLQAVRKKK